MADELVPSDRMLLSDTPFPPALFFRMDSCPQRLPGTPSSRKRKHADVEDSPMQLSGLCVALRANQSFWNIVQNYRTCTIGLGDEGINPDQVAVAVRAHPTVSFLDMGQCKHADISVSLRTLADNLPPNKIKSLALPTTCAMEPDVKDLQGVTGRILAQKLENLTSLACSPIGVLRLPTDFTHEFVRGLPALTDLSVCFHRSSSAAMAALRGAVSTGRLTSLAFGSLGSQIPLAAFKLIGQLQALNRLVLRSLGTHVSLHLLPRGLRVLHLDNVLLWQQGKEGLWLSDLPCLEELSFRRVRGISKKTARWVANLPMLASLQFDDASPRLLFGSLGTRGAASRLSSLKYTGSSWPQRVAFESLAAVTSLTSLDVSSCRDGYEPGSLVKLASLERLSLSANAQLPGDVSRLPLSNLKVASACYGVNTEWPEPPSSLSELELQGCFLYDSDTLAPGIAFVAKCKTLRTLRIHINLLVKYAERTTDKLCAHLKSRQTPLGSLVLIIDKCKFGRADGREAAVVDKIRECYPGVTLEFC